MVDDTLVAGAESVQYTVQGQRANLSGPASSILTVSFGKLPSGGQSVIVSAASETAPRAEQTLVGRNGIGRRNAHGVTLGC